MQGHENGQRPGFSLVIYWATRSETLVRGIFGTPADTAAGPRRTVGSQEDRPGGGMESAVHAPYCRNSCDIRKKTYGIHLRLLVTSRNATVKYLHIPSAFLFPQVVYLAQWTAVRCVGPICADVRPSLSPGACPRLRRLM
jgi:hypothetical protein